MNWTSEDRDRLRRKNKLIKEVLRKVPRKEGKLIMVDFISKTVIAKIKKEAA